jgi:hypothetical protein
MSIGTSLSIIINKNTATIVLLTKICCPSVLKKKRTHLSIRGSHSIIMNKNTAIIVSPTKIYYPSDLK